jgi:uncharacterized membrane protein (DUF2068 family)
MTVSSLQALSRSTPGPRHHNRWLILIAAFKLAQALLFIAVGVGAIRLLHKNVGELIEQLAHHLLRHNPEGRLINFLFERASLLNDHILRRIGAALFVYAALDLIEGTGLYLEKAWAEYLTLVITASFLPFEIIELFHKLTWIRVSLLTVNMLVLFYLLKLVLERGRRRGISATG